MENHPKDHDALKRKSLRYSVIEGAFYASMVGFGESYFVPYAVFLGAGAFTIGLLGSLPQMIGAAAQLVSGRLLGLFGGSRKKFSVAVSFAQAMVFAPLAMAYFFHEWQDTLLVITVCLYWAFGMLPIASWNSWIGDLTDERGRGRFFSQRNVSAGLSAFITFMTGGVVLSLLTRLEKGSGFEYSGFLIIFGLAMAGRLVSRRYLGMHYEPQQPEPSPAYNNAPHALSPWMFLKGKEYSGHRHLVIYLALMNFSIFISAPFFAPYLLKTLEMDYLHYSAVHGTAIIIKLLCMPIWGMITDRYGAMRALTVSGYMLPVIPLLWVLSADINYLIAVQAFSGFVWAGFETAAFVFMLDICRPEERTGYVSFYTAINGIAVFTGAMVGSYVVKNGWWFGWSPFLLAFFVSGCARFLAASAYLPGLKEVRLVESVSYRSLVMQMIGTIPTKGVELVLAPYRIIKGEDEPLTRHDKTEETKQKP